jgi:hypothetical protein
MCAKFWWIGLKGKGHSQGLDIDWRIILEWILGRKDRKVWTGFTWLRRVMSGELS